jgi:hypothetical protein
VAISKFESLSAEDGRITFSLAGDATDAHLQDAMSNVAPPNAGRSLTSADAHQAGGQKIVIGGNASAWGQFENGDVQTFNSADLTNGETGILATAHDGSRSINAFDLKPDHFVKIGDMETKVRDAVTSGYLKPKAGGGYENTAKGAAIGQPQATPTEPTAPQFGGKATTRKAMAEMEDALLQAADPSNAIAEVGKLPPAVVSELMQSVQSGTPLSKAQLQLVASNLNTTPAIAEGRLAAANEALVGQYRAMASLVGVDPDAAADWLNKHRGDTARSVLARHIAGGDGRVWLSQLKAYKAASGK